MLELLDSKVIELQILHSKLEATFREYCKYDDSNIDLPSCDYFEFDSRIYNTLESNEQIKTAIQSMNQTIKQTNELFIDMLIYADVAYRRKHRLLHTLPRSNLPFVKLKFPEIENDIKKSFIRKLSFDEEDIDETLQKRRVSFK